MMHFWGSNMGWGGMFFQSIPWILIIAVGVVLVGYFTGHRRTPHAPQRSESAMDILEKRYARGEIDQDEFERKKRDLTN